MTLLREICAWVGFLVISCSLLIALLVVWVALIAPPLDARRERRRAIEQVITESRFYLATHTHPHQ